MSVIGVDVDLTVCDVGPAWWRWMEAESGCWQDYPCEEDTPPESVCYDMSIYFTDQLWKRGIDPMDFYRAKDCYDHENPLPGAVAGLQALHNEGHEIVFISMITGGHFQSKKRFLEKYFPFMKAFIATGEKQYINLDVMVDDRNRFLNTTNAEVRIKIATPFTQCTELSVDVIECQGWAEIYCALTGRDV